MDTGVDQGVPLAACRAVLLTHGSAATFCSDITSTSHNTETRELKDVKEDSTELSVPLILRTVSHIVCPRGAESKRAG